jgi:hypothetical protein
MEINGRKKLLDIVEHEATVESSAEALHHKPVFKFGDHLKNMVLQVKNFSNIKKFRAKARLISHHGLKPKIH